MRVVKLKRRARFYLYARHWDPKKHSKRLHYIAPERQFHDRAAEMIARQCYDGKSNLTTWVNVPSHKMAVRRGTGQLVYVDILLVNGNNRLQRVAEVETVIDDESVQRLIVASSLAPLLDIYVLYGYGEKMRRILGDQHISYARIFEYYITPLSSLIVRPVGEPVGREQMA